MSTILESKGGAVSKPETINAESSVQAVLQAWCNRAKLSNSWKHCLNKYEEYPLIVL